MKLNKEKFFNEYRKHFGPLTQSQVDGLNSILDAYEASDWTDTRWLAYVLATVKHETAHTFQPIYERGPKNYFRYLIGKLGNRNFDMAYMYRGRGYVQLTGYDNYRSMGTRLELDLVNNPDLALDPNTAARIMFYGMLNGSFTGKSLSDYFSDTMSDPIGARRIINGKDKAQLISGYYYKFLDCL